MEKKARKYTIFFFCLILGVFSLGSFFKQDQGFSDNENRFLTQWPQFTWSEFLSRRYTPKLENYITDQFPFRSQWIVSKAMLSQGVGKLENNGIYFGEDRYLIPQRMLVKEESIKSNIEKMNQFQDKYPDVRFDWIVVPMAMDVAKDKLPPFAYNVDRMKSLKWIEENSKGNWVNLNELDDAKFYFKTDHHWNEEGAHVAYLSYMKTLQENPGIFTYEKVSSSFKGTSSSTSGAYYYGQDEIVKIIGDSQHESVTVFEDGTGFEGVYCDSCLEKKDKYTYYVDGNHPFTRITTKGIEKDLGKLLVLKDSYAHIMTPYLSNHFSEIILVDLRYYYDSVSQLIESEEISHVLYLYSLDTLMEEKNFVFLK